MRKSSPRRRPKKSTPGPKPSITLEVVKRVSRRVGTGLTLKLALAAEANPKINLETWKKALQAHPEFYPHYEAAKGKFLELAMERLAGADDLRHLCWLLERRHSDLFRKPADKVQSSVTIKNESKSLSDAELERIARSGSGDAAGAEEDQA